MIVFVKGKWEVWIEERCIGRWPDRWEAELNECQATTTIAKPQAPPKPQAQPEPSPDFNITWQGETKLLSEWASQCRMTPERMLQRYNRAMARTLCEAREQLRLTINGETKGITEWAKELGISPNRLYSRHYRGTPPERLLAPRKKPNYLTYDGQTMTLAAWARTIGVSCGTIRWRISKGWSWERVFSPAQYHKKSQ
jgi:hypothetical protein